MIKILIQQEDIMIKNIYILNTAPKYMMKKLIELKVETGTSIIIVTDFNIPTSIMDRTTRQNINI